MRSLVADAVRGSELIIFNRCDDVLEELGTYKRNIKAVNPQAEIVFEGKDGEISQIFEEDLPYDTVRVNATNVEINNEKISESKQKCYFCA